MLPHYCFLFFAPLMLKSWIRPWYYCPTQVPEVYASGRFSLVISAGAIRILNSLVVFTLRSISLEWNRRIFDKIAVLPLLWRICIVEISEIVAFIILHACMVDSQGYRSTTDNDMTTFHASKLWFEDMQSSSMFLRRWKKESRDYLGTYVLRPPCNS